MQLRLNGNTIIENLREYPQESIEKLRGLLAAGAQAQADPRRDNFYEVQNGTQVFYIHVSPVSGHVLLLAIWHANQLGQTRPAA